MNTRSLRRIGSALLAACAAVAGPAAAQMGAHLKSEMDRWVKLAREVKFELAD